MGGSGWLLDSLWANLGDFGWLLEDFGRLLGAPEHFGRFWVGSWATMATLAIDSALYLCLCTLRVAEVIWEPQLRARIVNLGTQAARRNGTLPAGADVALIHLMHDRGLVSKRDCGSFALTSVALAPFYEVSDPKAVTKFENLDVAIATRYELRRLLSKKGWLLVRCDATARGKRALKHKCKEYYLLLIEHLQDVEIYEERRNFSHSMCRRYYSLLLFIFENLTKSGQVAGREGRASRSIGLTFLRSVF